VPHPFPSDGLSLSGHVARPNTIEPEVPGLVLCHGFPTGIASATASAVSFPQLADRIAEEMGWVVLTFNFRGAGQSEGDFSLQGWLDDVHAAIERERASSGETFRDALNRLVRRGLRHERRSAPPLPLLPGDLRMDITDTSAVLGELDDERLLSRGGA